MRGRWRSLLLAALLTVMPLIGAHPAPAQPEPRVQARHTVTYDQYAVKVDGEPLYLWGA